MPDRCPFCQSIDPGSSPPNGGWLVEDGPFLAALRSEPDGPSYLGQILIQSRRHIPSLTDLTTPEGAALGPLLQRLSAALGDSVRPELVYLDCYMEVVRHVHMFLTPRYADTPREYWRLDVTRWPGAPRGDRVAIENLAERIRGFLGTHPGVPGARERHSAGRRSSSTREPRTRRSRSRHR